MEVTISNGTLIKIEEELETSNTNHILPSDVTVQGATKNDYSRDTAFEGSVELTNPTSSMTLTVNAPKILARKDLSTLGLTAGTHNIKARARATYYTESADSNVVQYTATQSGYAGAVTNTGYMPAEIYVDKPCSGSSDYTLWQTTGAVTFSCEYFYMVHGLEEHSVITATNCTYEPVSVHTTSYFYGYKVTPTADSWVFTAEFVD